jgi:outer membrane biosynthesis protein TonB
MNETNETLPRLHVAFRARLGDNAEISISGDDVELVSKALVHFNLFTPAGVTAPAPAAEPAPAPAPAEKKTRAKKETAAAPVEKPSEPTESQPATTSSADAPAAETEGNAAAASSEPEAPAAPAASSIASATPEEAAAAVKAYGAKNGIDAARALLQKFGFARTGDITAEKAGEIVEAAKA